ncbi:MAG TPA: FlgO family outer membrane protein [bacterium]|nr:FlgO family outer membrane protein [bacterium]
MNTLRSGVVLLLLLMILPLGVANAQWHKAYRDGLEQLEDQHYAKAAELFELAMREKSKDTNKIRAFGTVFIEYYPNRELGICHYYLGDMAKAQHYLQLSKSQSFSTRADHFLRQIQKGGKPPVPSKTFEEPEPELQRKPKAEPIPFPEIEEPVEPRTVIIGERMSLAVLPFDSKGFGQEIGNMDVLDKMITGLVNVNRFKVVERAQLEKILEEQKLGMSGILDASTAAKVGRGIGVDAVIVGSVTRSGNSVSIDARLIDTETAAILSAQDAFCNGVDLQSVSRMVYTLAEKIKGDFPIVNGYVINLDATRLTLDMGSQVGIRKGVKCHIYREGDSIIHPVSGKVIGKNIDEIAEVQIVDVYESYSIARVTKIKKDQPRNLDRVISK